MSASHIYAVYKIENLINGKCYIGISNNYKRRWREHKKSPYAVGKAIRKYGVDNFSFEVIYCASTFEHVMEMETFFIKEYNSKKAGYNLTEGGEGTVGRIVTPEQRKILSDKNRVRYLIEFDNGSTKEIFGMYDFCEKYNYDRRHFYKVLNNQRPRHKDIVAIQQIS
jgi:group I intron endonuclease